MLEEKDLQAIAQLMEKQKQDIMSETKGLLAQQQQEILDENTRRMKLLLDTEVQTKFNLLAEGQRDILDALTPKSEIEELRNEVSVLKLAILRLCFSNMFLYNFESVPNGTISTIAQTGIVPLYLVSWCFTISERFWTAFSLSKSWINSK